MFNNFAIDIIIYKYLFNVTTPSGKFKSVTVIFSIFPKVGRLSLTFYLIAMAL